MKREVVLGDEQLQLCSDDFSEIGFGGVKFQEISGNFISPSNMFVSNAYRYCTGTAARAFISPTAFEQARGGALGAGGGRVGFAGGGLF